MTVPNRTIHSPTTSELDRMWKSIDSMEKAIQDLERRATGHAGPTVNTDTESSRVGGASSNASRPKGLDTSFGAGGPAWIRDTTVLNRGLNNFWTNDSATLHPTPAPDYATENPAEVEREEELDKWFSENAELRALLREARLVMPGSRTGWHEAAANLLRGT